jgi:hypothetical protein
LNKDDPTWGSVFLIPLRSGEYIVAQVGRGGDLGVFDLTTVAQSAPELIGAHILFRVDYGRKSPKKFGWINAGFQRRHPDLQDFALYGHHAVGETAYYGVSHEPREFLISKEKYDTLEPLATWSHEHIIDRFMRESRSS